MPQFSVSTLLLVILGVGLVLGIAAIETLTDIAKLIANLPDEFDRKRLNMTPHQYAEHEESKERARYGI